MNRRKFLSVSSAALVAPAFPNWVSAAVPREYWISAQGKTEFGLAWYDQQTGDTTQVTTGFRGHEVLALPGQRLLVVARRPGRQLAVADLHSGTVVARSECPTNHVLAGHARVSSDGRLIYIPEADERNGDGYIGIYHADTLQRIAEFSSYGIGPHQLAFLPDQKTLVVANGGIHTRAATGKKVLNLDSMDSNLVTIDIATGKLLTIHKLAEPKAGLRHLAVSKQGDVVVATQLQRAAMSHNEVIPLGALQTPGGALQPLQAPHTIWAAMRDYAASVAINSSTQIAGITSPRGNLAVFFSITTGEFLDYHAFHDVCGITCSADEQRFILSNSQGQLRQLDAITLKERVQQRTTVSNCAWDNHLSVLTT